MKKYSFFRPACLVFLILSTMSGTVLAFQNRYLSDVLVRPAQVDPTRSASAVITWQTHVAGTVDLLICDMDGIVVRRLLDQTRKSIGTHSASWDGRDDNGRLLPSGAYFPFLRITTDRQSSELYDPTQGRWGGRLPTEDIAYDPDRKQIAYSLGKPALCQVRVGEKEGGPCYGTLLRWVPRAAGNHSEYWDGKDLQGLAVVYQREKFEIVFDTLALPANTLLLQGSQAVYTKPDAKADRMAIHPPSGKEVYLHSVHPRYLCQDPVLEVMALEGLEIGERDIPVSVGGSIRFEVTAADPGMAENMQREGCEVYAFVDGVFQYEVKAAKLPAPVVVATRGMRPGPHVITFNLRSIEDHVGSYSLKIIKQ